MRIKKDSMMRKMFGVTHGKKCSECRNLICIDVSNKNVYKCLLYGTTSSEATDWRLKYQACGMFNKPVTRLWNPVIDVMRHMPKSALELPIEGQIRIEDIE